jgi:ribosome-interacting GTPase 1
LSDDDFDVVNQNRCPNYAMISAHKEWNLNGLIEQMWGAMKLIRVGTKFYDSN